MQRHLSPPTGASTMARNLTRQRARTRGARSWPIARAYGSHSLRRARRLLTYIEEQGLIVCQLDGLGRRTVTLVELAWATAPGDPNAEEAAQGSLAV